MFKKTKACSKCGEELPLTIEYFSKAKNSKDGFNVECKKCAAKRHKEYYESNKNKIVERVRKYRKYNREKIIKSLKKYYETNKDEFKQYYETNKDKRTKYYKKWCNCNKEKIAECNKKWRKANPEKGRMYVQRRRSRKSSLPSSLTLEQWDSIKSYFNNSCAYCGIAEEKCLRETSQHLHQEHFIPLSKGGKYTYNNIIPACKYCNCSKHDENFFSWYPKQEFYSKEREQKILDFLGYMEQIELNQIKY